MTHRECKQVRQRLDDLLDGYLPRDEAAVLERHIAACPGCAAERTAVEALRIAVRQMPLPEPRPDFVEAALAAAVRHAPAPAAARAPRISRRRYFGRWRRLELWTGAALGAAAAAALVAVFLGVPRSVESPADPASVRLNLYETREIGVAIDTDTAIPGATLTVSVEGGIDLAGFGERREIRWQTDLDPGTNMLSLPIIAHSLEAGRLTALVEHGDKSRRIAVDVRVDSPAAD